MKILILSALLLAGGPGEAEVRDVRPASPEGKMLTMEETILSRDILPAWSIRKAISEELKAAAEDGISFREAEPDRKEILDGQSLYYKDGDSAPLSVAISESPDITYGQTVSRNEFGIDGGCFWSPDRTRLAFYRKDESLVTDFPLLDITTRTGTLRSIKYPMNGMDSERVSLGIFNTLDGSTVYVAADDFEEDRYLTGVSWGPDGKYIFIQVLDRSQKHCRLNMYRASDGSFVRTLLTEDSDKYTEPLDPLHFIGGDYLFLYRTASRDGYRNLYLCDTLGTVRRATVCDADVSYLCTRGNSVYYTSAEPSPVENHLYRLDITPARGGKAGQASAARIRSERLTHERGSHSIAVSTD